MADLNLDILVIQTFNKLTLGVADISTYPDSPPVQNPSITISIPSGFDTVTVPFTTEDFNVFNSTNLGITGVSEELTPIPDGIYTLTYSVTPSFENYVTKTIIRVEKLQEKYDNAFMKLDMTECDRAIKKQAIETLTTIEFFIQSAVSAANNCATNEANKLYNKANQMLDNLIRNDCGCSGNNYVINYP